MNSNRNYVANKNHKSTVFSKLFGEDKENALSLYNAMNNSNYTNADDLTFTTLDDVVYMKMKINAGMNPELLAKCKALGDYATFLDKVRSYNKSMPLTAAVDQAVDECVEAGVLEEFLSRHRREVRNMVLTEFDEEKFLRMVRAEEREEGRAEGERNLLIKVLSKLGFVSEELQNRIRSIDDETLVHWTQLASRADSMEEFLEQIK